MLAAGTPLRLRTNALFKGSHVVSGTGLQLAVHTGGKTELGRIAERLGQRPEETAFERGVHRFGYFLLEVTLMLSAGIFALNVQLERPVLDSLLFALALAVGLTPQLLPAIVSVNLAHGARRMAARKVVVKRLAAIENLASMTVLCCDKTGTLTEGAVRLESALDVAGRESARVLLHAALNSAFETGYTNPMDAALLARHTEGLEGWRKLDEEPYDFVRRRMSVLVERGSRRILVTKGALPNVLAACSQAEIPDGAAVPLAEALPAIDACMQDLSRRGLRVLGVAYRPIAEETRVSKEHETGMTFLGMLAFADPLKRDIAETLATLRTAGIRTKIVTGDHRLVALEVARRAGFQELRSLTGPELHQVSDEALLHRANEVDVFAEVEPNQKERVILALRKSGQVVGYLGDGVNDASALHAADVGISVSGAAEVARQAADVVMLEPDLAILGPGVEEGRRTFANTLKYVFMATSANFGNMFSMAGASLLIPFLPLLPKQILLMNLLADLPEMAIAADRVDEEWLRQPRRWNLKSIRRFMTVFGLLSSLFDFVTFGVLLLAFRAGAEVFRSAWFVESVLSVTLSVFVLRTPRPVWRSRPGALLVSLTLFVIGAALVLPFSPAGPTLGFVPLGGPVLVAVVVIALAYGATTEGAKRVFHRKVAMG
jgi:Mg2+-importing ATPase